MPAPSVPQATPAGSSATTSATFTISELSREFDLTTRAIRFYEDCGLLAPARGGAGGRQRVYTARDRTRLKLTLRGKRLGLSLAEIKLLVDMYESPRDTVPQLTRFLEVLGEHRAQIEQQMADLQATLDEVRAHEREAKRLLAAGAAGGRAAKAKAA
ncbi:MerR family transcriptional regulator [Caldimonas sp. KR1-144]|uniref:MerR family transcriptional regulator n=1 Tax=Caldimonas sp. KR1-144 TaxID=3400911 RepID=UPI003BFD9273